MIDTGGAAFPFVEDKDHPWRNNYGMTLRDWFAGQALAGLMAIPGSSPPALDAMLAFEYADAMIAARGLDK